MLFLQVLGVIIGTDWGGVVLDVGSPGTLGTRLLFAAEVNAEETFSGNNMAIGAGRPFTRANAILMRRFLQKKSFSSD